MPVYLSLYNEIRLAILNLGLIIHVRKVLIEKAGHRLMQEFSAFHKTQKFEKPPLLNLVASQLYPVYIVTGCYFYNHFNVIVLSALRFPLFSLPFTLLNEKSVCISHLPYASSTYYYFP
jgi:hypothetical protein